MRGAPVPNELSSIEGLADKHLRVLARHYVTDLRGLVQADRRVICRAMVNLRPRPTLELISRWQDEARSMLDEVVTDTSEWHTVASFAVIFSQRQREDGWERRVEVERTEVEPERNPQVWPGWDCAPICAWMTGQLSPPPVPHASPPPDAPPPAELPPPAEAAEPPPPAEAEAPAPAPMPPPSPATARPQLHIDSAALIDATGRTDVVTGGEPAADPRTELVAPVRAVLTVSGAKPGTPLRAVTRIQRPDGPGWNPRDPVILPDSGQAEFDLSEVPAGDHQLSLIAWAPDASAKPVSVRLPRITIRDPRGH
jgi:hypothetical protein